MVEADGDRFIVHQGVDQARSTVDGSPLVHLLAYTGILGQDLGVNQREDFIPLVCPYAINGTGLSPLTSLLAG